MKRERSARILATLGPASSTRERIRALAEAGADVFRLNFSHGSHEDHAERYRLIRAVEAELGRPIGVLMDLQGPKLRVGRFAEGKVALVPGASFRLDLDPTPGDARRANLPHPEIFAALEAGTALLLDDGKLRLRVDACGADFAETTVLVGGTLSDRKGVNVPGVVLPISPLTAKDRADLDFGLALGVDWVALSFVQRPEDLREARELVGDRAWIMAKLEKPAAIDALEPIVALADGVMVARGDLGVELPPQQVPVLQRRIVRAARAAGRPVVVSDPVPPQSVIDHAQAIGADLWRFGQDFNYSGDPQQWGWAGRGRRYAGLSYPALRGANQLVNAAGVLAAFEALRDKVPVTAQAVRTGLAMVELPGRFQVLPGEPVLVLDVAHNPHSVAALAANLDSMGATFPTTHAVVGAMADKDLAPMLEKISPLINRWYFTDLPVPRAAKAQISSSAIIA